MGTEGSARRRPVEVSSDVEPFRIDIPQSVLVDLRDRLANTRWPGSPSDPKWDHGTPESYLQELTQYWQDAFDWRAHERDLNSLAHFRTEIHGVGIHFIHQRGVGEKPLPLVLTHGYPD